MPESEHIVETEIPLPKLMPWEDPSTLQIEEVPQYIPKQPPSAIYQLQRLAQVKSEGEIGKFGPSLAALALERPEEAISPELRKYEVFFCRDGYRVALDVLPIFPALMHVTIHESAALQGVMTYSAREEEDGRFFHEDRKPNDPIARELTEKYGWEWPYYGAVDTTPTFMHAIFKYYTEAPGGASIFHETVARRDGQQRTLAEVYKKALMWVENRLNANPEGLLEFKSAIPHGIENQVWRDSWDSYFHANGTLANRNHGIASVEVQQLVYDALVEGAYIFEKEFLDQEKSAQLLARAERMRQTILDTFWVEEKGGYFALGTDRDDSGNVRPLKIRTSNMGHLLNSRLLEGEAYRPYREAVITQLFSPEMLNVSGIRTLASDEVRFRPGAYHNGSVWLWDTYYIAEGLRHHGYYGLASLLANKIHTVINVTQKFPEYVRGDDFPIPRTNSRKVTVWDTSAQRVNTIEQPPQEVQAWSVAAEIRRDYFSGTVPEHAYDARSVLFEDAILSTLE